MESSHSSKDRADCWRLCALSAIAAWLIAPSGALPQAPRTVAPEASWSSPATHARCSAPSGRFALARGVPGVRDVNSQIVLRPRRTVSAPQLEAELRYALRTDPAVQSRYVSIETTDDGQVMPGGRVESSAQRYLVEQVAKSMVGVTAVRNELELQLIDYLRADTWM